VPGPTRRHGHARSQRRKIPPACPPSGASPRSASSYRPSKNQASNDHRRPEQGEHQRADRDNHIRSRLLRDRVAPDINVPLHRQLRRRRRLPAAAEATGPGGVRSTSLGGDSRPCDSGESLWSSRGLCWPRPATGINDPLLPDRIGSWSKGGGRQPGSGRGSPVASRRPAQSRRFQTSPPGERRTGHAGRRRPCRGRAGPARPARSRRFCSCGTTRARCWLPGEVT
jgi:hypothetical protein